MNFSNRLKEYFGEIIVTVKNNYISIVIFIIAAVILDFLSISFLSVLLMIILIFKLSKTQDYKPGKLKILNFAVFFVFLVFFIMLFLIPVTILFIGYDVSSLEQIRESNLTQFAAKFGAYISILFMFAPYRILDANANIFSALKYSCNLIITNFTLFAVVALFLIILNILTANFIYLEFYLYLVTVIMTSALYRLNVKNTLYTEK